MNTEVKEALLQLAEMCARKGYREYSGPFEPQPGVVSLDDIFEEILRQGVPEEELQERFDTAAIAAEKAGER